VALDLKTAMAQYGTLGLLASSIPELKAKLEQGAKDEWTPDKFWAEIQQTKWWNTTSETRRQATILSKTDPGTWAQTVANTAQKVARMAAEMGVRMARADIESAAKDSLVMGLDDTMLRDIVGRRGAAGTGQDYRGAAAEMEAQIRATYVNNGLRLTDDVARRNVNEILAGRQTLATYENLARQQAKSRYPNLAEQLDAGMTVRDVASPYLAQMADTLEINEVDLDLNDQAIQRALTDRDEKGTARTKPLWQFERELKDDPRWDKTKNAQNQTYDMLARIGQDWGFSA
jgi:hypothetical protein